MILKPDSPLIHALHPSPNTEDRRKGCRADMIVLHYTGMSSADKAIRWLANPKSKVSCHYVIDEAGGITQMVAETQRAWHAGASHWAGETDINSVSIGIEVQNPGHEHGYPEYPAERTSHKRPRIASRAVPLPMGRRLTGLPSTTRDDG